MSSVEFNEEDFISDEPTEPIRCMLCGGLMAANYLWWEGSWHRSHTVHESCLNRWNKKESKPGKKRYVPEKFTNFDGTRLDPDAVALAAEFSPDSEHHTLAIVGLPGRGKSRLVWASVKGFFDQLELEGTRTWVEYYSFADVIAEYDKGKIAQIKNARYVFVDNIGCVDSFGRERAALQAALRARVERNAWTWLSIDAVSFDPDLVKQLQDKSTLILLEQ